MRGNFNYGDFDQINLQTPWILDNPIIAMNRISSVTGNNWSVSKISAAIRFIEISALIKLKIDVVAKCNGNWADWSNNFLHPSFVACRRFLFKFWSATCIILPRVGIFQILSMRLFGTTDSDFVYSQGCSWATYGISRSSEMPCCLMYSKEYSGHPPPQPPGLFLAQLTICWGETKSLLTRFLRKRAFTRAAVEKA